MKEKTRKNNQKFQIEKETKDRPVDFIPRFFSYVSLLTNAL